MWLARCAHVARLPPPRRFRELMDAVPPIPSCHDYLLATGRFAGEFWILSHPAVVAVDVLPLQTFRGRPIGFTFSSFELPKQRFWLPRPARFPRPGLTAAMFLNNSKVPACAKVAYRMDQYRAAFGPAAAAAGFPAGGLHCAWLNLTATSLPGPDAAAAGQTRDARLELVRDARAWLPRTCGPPQDPAMRLHQPPPAPIPSLPPAARRAAGGDAGGAGDAGFCCGIGRPVAARCGVCVAAGGRRGCGRPCPC